MSRLWLICFVGVACSGEQATFGNDEASKDAGERMTDSPGTGMPSAPAVEPSAATGAPSADETADASSETTALHASESVNTTAEETTEGLSAAPSAATTESEVTESSVEATDDEPTVCQDECCADADCDEGYSCVQSECEDDDECLADNGGCGAGVDCVNLPGEHSCGDCPVGFAPDAQGDCQDIDECQSNNGGCDLVAPCQNTDGGRTCGACPSGYSGNGLDGCVLIVECDTDCGLEPGGDGCRVGTRSCAPVSSDVSATVGQCVYADVENGETCADGNADAIAGSCQDGVCGCAANYQSCSAPRNGCFPDTQCCQNSDCDDGRICSDQGSCECEDECCSAEDCSNAAPFCQAGECVICVADQDCPTSAAAHCGASNSCTACTSDDQCAHLSDTPICNAGACVECTGAKDDQCGTYVCDSLNHQCASSAVANKAGQASLCAPCLSDKHCGDGLACVGTTFFDYGDFGALLPSTITVPGYFCQWEPGTTDAPAECTPELARPFIKTSSNLTTLDGRTGVTTCGLRASSCPAQDLMLEPRIGCGAHMLDDPDCGAAPFEDAMCNEGNECAPRCAGADDCQPGRNCWGISQELTFCY